MLSELVAGTRRRHGRADESEHRSPRGAGARERQPLSAEPARLSLRDGRSGAGAGVRRAREGSRDARRRPGSHSQPCVERLPGRAGRRLRGSADGNGRHHRSHALAPILSAPGERYAGRAARSPLRLVQRPAARHVPARARARARCAIRCRPRRAHRHDRRTRARRADQRAGRGRAHRDAPLRERGRAVRRAVSAACSVSTCRCSASATRRSRSTTSWARCRAGPR